MQTNEPTVKKLEDRQVAYVSFKGNYMANKQVFKGLFDKLMGWAGPKNLMKPDTSFSASYYDDPNITPLEEMRLDICMSIADDVEVDGEVKKTVMPGGEYAVMHVELENPEEYGDAWMELVKWVQSNSHSIDMSRPSYELYLNNPEDHPEKHHMLDMCMAVK